MPWVVLIFALVLALAACDDSGDTTTTEGSEAAPTTEAAPAAEVSAADLSCAGCHDDTTLIAGKADPWGDSLHGSGESFVRGTSASCAGCHSGGAFSASVVAGLNPGEIEAGDPDPTRQTCRACHQIHETYTDADWGLETTDPVGLYAIEGQTYDGGEGNLCVNCHQPRRTIDPAVDGMIEITSTHWGPHHGPQSAMMLGLAGAGIPDGTPMSHYTAVGDTCVGCHMGETDSHFFEPTVAVCQECHAEVEDFDVNGVQTEVQAMLDELEAGLVARGWLDEEGHPAVTSVPEAEAAALWNWIYIAHEDKSLGVHNPAYTKALLEAGLAALGG
jgi:hypothetical protein